MFVDKAKAHIKAGKGGNGAVSFRHEKYIDRGGPDGGDGGKGGSIIFRADKGVNTLVAFRFEPLITAQDGKNGSKRKQFGRKGEDLIIKVPVGTIVKRDGEEIADLTYDGEEAVVAKGGDGGFGNAHFKSSTRQAPKVAELGEPGEEFEAEIELKLLAEVGLVGFPNAGKSTFLATVSNATPEIADYAFTTLTPNLGVATIDEDDILIADIPGLIEGAADGKGLGFAFLRHIERTSIILHLIDAYDENVAEKYKTIRKELEKYSEILAQKREVIALTKTEGLDDDIINLQRTEIQKVSPNAEIFAISSQAHKGIKELLRALRDDIKEVKANIKAEEIAAKEQEEKAAKNAEGLEVISLKSTKSKKDDAYHIEQLDNGNFKVTGEKIEKFARRTDLENYDSLNRLRDIMKKLGIRGELTTKGATPESIIEIADKKFTLVEQ